MTGSRRLCALMLSIMLFAGAQGCAVIDTDSSANNDPPVSQAVEKEPLPDINDVTITDNKLLYAHDDEDSVVTMYLTVSRGAYAENTDHSWKEINSYSIFDYEAMGVERYQVEGLLQVGDEDGPVVGQLGYGLKIPNAVVQIRGATTSRTPQKSYKIELNPNSGLWRDQRTIALNKHIYDGLRFRNKLCYDLIKQIPDMISLRTQFVHLYVKDDTDGAGQGFVDYGLFTQVEQPNSRFLRSHGLDSGGQLYKMNLFEFFPYQDQVRLKTDKNFDKAKFESLLETKGNDDHSKMIALLEDINNDAMPIEEVFGKHFDEDNYFTWLAFNILTGNIDTQSRNYYLYSPLNSNKWYFMNWDCDAALLRNEFGQIDMDKIGFEYGISNYAGDQLFSRVVRIPRYRELLDQKIELLRKIITPQKIYSLAEQYRKVVMPYLYRMPDAMYATLTKEEYDRIFGLIGSEVEMNYNLYKLSLEMPLPFYCDTPRPQNDELVFQWDSSFDLDGQDITYSFELARDYLCQDIIKKDEGLRFPTTKSEMLKPGKYFFRVRATNEDGKTQYALPYYVLHSKKYFGTQCFYVLENGKIVLELPK